jgi:hypothetical protein
MINQHKAEALLALEDKRGRIAPRRVVDAARDPSHPLHDLFPWDDSIAAERYRLDIAARIIREVRIITEVEDRPVRSIRYVRDPSLPPSASGYVALTSIARRSQAAIMVVAAEIDRAIGAVTRARAIADHVGLRDECERELRRLILLREKAEHVGRSKRKPVGKRRPRVEARP